MKSKILYFIASVTVLLIMGFTASAKTYTYTGKLTADIGGKTEIHEGKVLKAEDNGTTATFEMKDIEMKGIKGISITGSVTHDASGKITGYSNIVTKGAPTFNVKSISGTFNENGASIDLEGKAMGGMVKIKAHFSGK